LLIPSYLITLLPTIKLPRSHLAAFRDRDRSYVGSTESAGGTGSGSGTPLIELTFVDLLFYFNRRHNGGGNELGVTVGVLNIDSMLPVSVGPKSSDSDRNRDRDRGAPNEEDIAAALKAESTASTLLGGT